MIGNVEVSIDLFKYFDNIEAYTIHINMHILKVMVLKAPQIDISL